MDLYLSKGFDFKPDKLIDDYDSIIWTDRYSGHGEFQLKVKHLPELTVPTHDLFLLSSESRSVMMIENVESDTKNGTSLQTVTGRSIEAFMYNRTNTTTAKDNNDIFLTGSIGDMVEYLVDRYLINTTPTMNRMEGLAMGYVHKGAPADRYVKRDLMYNVIKNLADSEDYGFSIITSTLGSAEPLTFYMDKGIDATDPATSWYREYSQDLGSLDNPTYFRSIAEYKTHARVQGYRANINVYIDGYTEETTLGFNRRTLVVDAGDVGRDAEEGTTWEDDLPTLQQRGYDALRENNNKAKFLVTGDVSSQDWNLIYYGLGDLVIVRDKEGNRSAMRITEDIHTQDARGYRRIPGFSSPN